MPVNVVGGGVGVGVDWGDGTNLFSSEYTSRGFNPQLTSNTTIAGRMGFDGDTNVSRGGLIYPVGVPQYVATLIGSASQTSISGSRTFSNVPLSQVPGPSDLVVVASGSVSNGGFGNHIFSDAVYNGVAMNNDAISPASTFPNIIAAQFSVGGDNQATATVTTNFGSFNSSARGSILIWRISGGGGAWPPPAPVSVGQNAITSGNVSTLPGISIPRGGVAIFSHAGGNAFTSTWTGPGTTTEDADFTYSSSQATGGNIAFDYTGARTGLVVTNTLSANVSRVGRSIIVGYG